MSRQGREVRLAARPTGEPVASDFELADVEVPDPAPGEVLVRNLVMSVDPYMRGRMNDVKSYVPPFQVGAALDGGAVGQVVASTVDTHTEGDLVLHRFGWRDLAVGPASGFTVLAPTDRPSDHLGVLGMPGLTAWAGLFAVARFEPGETVFVSGAAGAVGSLVGQLVKARGGTVIGSAGSAAKTRWLTEELGFDAAIGSLGVHGRAVICGMISAYNATEPPAAPRNLAMVIGKRLRIEGMLVSDHDALRPEFEREVTAMLADGRVQAAETVVEGLDHAAEAFIGLLRGDNTGKMVVRL